MIEYAIGSGRVLLLDDEFAWIADLRPILHWPYGKAKPLCYARIEKGERNKTRTYVHRIVIGAAPGQLVDHLNRDGLDCRRANLRFATKAENGVNVKREPGASGFVGVRAQRSRFAARFSERHLGTFDTAEEAARAYDCEVRARFGAHAFTNF